MKLMLLYNNSLIYSYFLQNQEKRHNQNTNLSLNTDLKRTIYKTKFIKKLNNKNSKYFNNTTIIVMLLKCQNEKELHWNLQCNVYIKKKQHQQYNSSDI